MCIILMGLALNKKTNQKKKKRNEWNIGCRHFVVTTQGILVVSISSLEAGHHEQAVDLNMFVSYHKAAFGNNIQSSSCYESIVPSHT